MTALFLKILNMSISASWLVLAVLGMRCVFRKAPRWFNVLLWGIVALRLLFPFSIESALSLIPSAQTIPETVLNGPSLDVQIEITPADGQGINHAGTAVSVGNGFQVMTALGIVWLVGMLLMAAYTAISYGRLRKKVDTAVLLRENIFQSEAVASPFVLGVIRPRIYLPFKLEAQNLEYVVAHEKAHIRRGDHWWKPLGFLLLTIHWFNPLMWVAYVLLCRDIELACDEKVIAGLDSDGRADYTQALVACSMDRRTIAACPLAFGEVSVKKRVKSVMVYRKPGLRIIILAVISSVAMAVCFLTDPVSAAEETVPAVTAPPASGTGDARTKDNLPPLKTNVNILKAMGAEIGSREATEIIRARLYAIDFSPEGSFDPEVHIKAHPSEFQDLVSFGEYTLYYCFSEFSKESMLGLKGRIMTLACHEIAVQWGDSLLTAETTNAVGLQWFDSFQTKVMELSDQYTDEEFRNLYPASWILLNMMGG